MGCSVGLRREAVAALGSDADPIVVGTMLERLGRALWYSGDGGPATEASIAALVRDCGGPINVLAVSAGPPLERLRALGVVYAWLNDVDTRDSTLLATWLIPGWHDVDILPKILGARDLAFTAKLSTHNALWREWLTESLSSNSLTVIPSQANFILVTVPSGKGREAYLGLKQQGILVRYFDKPGLTDKIRITVGTSQENNALIGGIKALGAAEKAA